MAANPQGTNPFATNNSGGGVGIRTAQPQTGPDWANPNAPPSSQMMQAGQNTPYQTPDWLTGGLYYANQPIQNYPVQNYGRWNWQNGATNGQGISAGGWPSAQSITQPWGAQFGGNQAPPPAGQIGQGPGTGAGKGAPQGGTGLPQGAASPGQAPASPGQPGASPGAPQTMMQGLMQGPNGWNQDPRSAQQDPQAVVQQFLAAQNDPAAQFKIYSDPRYQPMLQSNPQVLAAMGGKTGLNTFTNQGSYGYLPGQANNYLLGQ